MTELPVAIIFDKISSCANPLVVKCQTRKWGTFHLTNIQNSNDFKERKMCIKGRAAPWAM